VPHLKTILQQLKAHSIQPPEVLFNSIAKKTAGISPKVISDDETEIKQFEQLRQNDIQPPAFISDRIFETIGEQQQSRATTTRLFRLYAYRAAATVVVLAGIWGIYKSLNHNSSSAEKKLATEIVHQGTRAVVDSVDKKPTEKDLSIVALHPAHKKKSSPDASPTITATGEGYNFAIKDNDLLGSFASFDYKNLPDFVTSDETTAVKINVDRSTAITVSEGMVAMLKRMYKTKRNGKPTWKAKRERKKIQRWKKADAKFFDKNPEKNPMDPLDLAEFIF